MRVTSDELVVHTAGNLLQPRPALLGQEKGQKVDLEEEVPELVGELRIVTRDRGVRHLVGLLDGVGDDRPLGLLAVPGTVTPEPLGQRLEVDQRLSEAQFTASGSSSP